MSCFFLRKDSFIDRHKHLSCLKRNKKRRDVCSIMSVFEMFLFNLTIHKVYLAVNLRDSKKPKGLKNLVKYCITF